MYLLRSASQSDLEGLFYLSGLMTFINLPHDKGELREILNISDRSFKNPRLEKEKNTYVFVLENTKTGEILGSSVIHGRHGEPNEPHYYFKVGREKKTCESLGKEFIHGTLKLGIDTHGYTEIGGLVLSPKSRGTGERLGKQLSFCRFLYMASRLDQFCEKTHSELMPPFDEKGRAPLWEAIGRRFLNMDYYDADKLSRKNTDFILSLFPSSNIYQTLLPREAREAIGKVGEATLPVKGMLEKIGFKYTNEVDPFDGGPHYRCLTNKIRPISDFKTGVVNKMNPSVLNKEGVGPRDYLVEIRTEHPFAAVKKRGIFMDGKIFLEDFKGLLEGDRLPLIPLNY